MSEYQTKLKELASAYISEFGEGVKLDAEWTATAYQDLSVWYKSRYSWAEFHEGIRKRVED